MQFRKMRQTASANTSSIISAAAGLTLFAAGAGIEQGSDIGGDVRQLGSVVLVGVIVRVFIRPAVVPVKEVWARAHQQGVDEGWQLGYRQARPVVVRLHPEMADISEANPN